MNLGVLCNSKLSLPSVQTLLQLGHSITIGLPELIGKDHAEIEQFAFQYGIPITRLTKETLDTDLIFWKERNGLEFIFVITFPFILSAKIIADIKLDIINFHFTPLPQYRGAQPAFWVLKNGEKNGGITAHVITEKLDEGPIVHFEPYTMQQRDTFGSYLAKMATLNCKVIQKTLIIVSKNNWKKGLKVQNKSLVAYYPKPQLKDIRVDWNTMTAIEIERLCRACNPWNKGVITTLMNFPIKLLEVEPLHLDFGGELPGQIVVIQNPKRIAIATSDRKYLEIKIAYEESFGFFGNDRLSDLGFTEGSRLI